MGITGGGGQEHGRKVTGEERLAEIFSFSLRPHVITIKISTSRSLYWNHPIITTRTLMQLSWFFARHVHELQLAALFITIRTKTLFP